MSWTEAISTHYTKNWNVQPAVCRFRRGAVYELPKEFKVLAFPPHSGRPLWTYATCGMSLPSDKNPVELHIFSYVQSEKIVELLFAISHFHRTGARLDLWHSVNFGRPWLSGSSCSFGLVSLPYLDGPTLENFECREGIGKIYWLIPITEAELKLKKASGIEALEELFDTSGFVYAESTRASVV